MQNRDREHAYNSYRGNGGAAEMALRGRPAREVVKRHPWLRHRELILGVNPSLLALSGP